MSSLLDEDGFDLLGEDGEPLIPDDEEAPPSLKGISIPVYYPRQISVRKRKRKDEDVILATT
jgi:hypothetical protein